MPGFTDTERAAVNRAYDQASGRITDLEDSNASRPSQLRQAAIDELQAHQQQIEALGYFDKDDFTLEEIKAVVEAAGALAQAEETIGDVHAFVLMELQTDFAELLLKLGLNDFLPMLKLHWIGAKRSSPLPDDIPEDVCDDFNVGIFNKTQGRLNQIAHNTRDVSRRGCMNSDDYAPADFRAAVLNGAKLSAKDAVDNYLALQAMKAAHRAAQAEPEVSIGGQIWDVIGWESPTDFLWDVGLGLLTGGASKVYRWGKKIARVTRTATKTVSKLEKTLEIGKQAQRLEDRIRDVRSAAEKLKKAQNIARLPGKIEEAFKVLNKAQGRLRLAQEIGSKVTLDYVRGVVSSVLAKSTGLGGSQHVGAAMTKEAAKMSIHAYLDGTALGKEIKELRGKINYKLMIATGFNARNQERMMAYFALLMVRELIARLAITMLHKRTDITAEHFISEFVDSAASALDTMLQDVPFVSEAKLKAIGRTIISTIRKMLAEMAKEQAAKLLGP
jgi:hypothetical protein